MPSAKKQDSPAQETARSRVARLYKRLGRWRLVGRELNISPAMAWRIAHGQKRATPAVQRRLQLLFSSQGRLLKEIRAVAVPFLRKRERRKDLKR